MVVIVGQQQQQEADDKNKTTKSGVVVVHGRFVIVSVQLYVRSFVLSFVRWNPSILAAVVGIVPSIHRTHHVVVV